MGQGRQTLTSCAWDYDLWFQTVIRSSRFHRGSSQRLAEGGVAKIYGKNLLEVAQLGRVRHATQTLSGRNIVES